MINFKFIFLAVSTFLFISSCTDNGSDAATDTNQTDDTSKTSEHNESGSICSDLKCEADLEAANSYFIKGDFKNAFEQYKCGDSAEAAAGAALSKTFMLLESDEATSLLKDLGIDDPFPAKDMFGPDGIIARIGKQVNGTGSFKLTSPGISIDDNFENIHFHETNYETGISIGVSDGSADIVPADDSTLPYYSIRAETYSLTESLDIDIDFRPGIEWEKGDIISFEQDCATGQEIPDPLIDDFDIYVDRQIDDIYSWCHLSFNYSECSDIIGTVEVLEYSDNGENVELALNNIPMVCYPDESSDREYGYFSGTVSATAIKASTLDYTGLHSLIKDEGLNTDNIPAALTVKNIVNDIYPLRDDIQLAACYAQHATNGGTAPVFTYPSQLTGYKEMPLTSRDMLTLTTALYGADSLLAIAGSYDIPLHIKKMENMTNTELCDEINTYIGSLKTDNHMSEAKKSLETALDFFIKALELKEDIGIFATNKDTYKGDDVLMEYATAALSSLTDGVIDVPYTAPPVKLNLKALFDNPPDPSKIDADPVVCETEIDGTDEYVYIEAVEVFYKDLLKDIIPGFDFDIEETDFGNKYEDMENSGEQIFIQIDKGIDI